MKRLTVFGVAGLQPCVKTVASWPDLCPNNGSRQPRAGEISVTAAHGLRQLCHRPAKRESRRHDAASRPRAGSVRARQPWRVRRRWKDVQRGRWAPDAGVPSGRSFMPRKQQTAPCTVTRARSVAAHDDHPPGKAQRPELEEVVVPAGVLLPLLGYSRASAPVWPKPLQRARQPPGGSGSTVSPSAPVGCVNSARGVEVSARP